MSRCLTTVLLPRDCPSAGCTATSELGRMSLKSAFQTCHWPFGPDACAPLRRSVARAAKFAAFFLTLLCHARCCSARGASTPSCERSPTRQGRGEDGQNRWSLSRVPPQTRRPRLTGRKVMVVGPSVTSLCFHLEGQLVLRLPVQQRFVQHLRPYMDPSHVC